jgi:hypothetical protein
MKLDLVFQLFVNVPGIVPPLRFTKTSEKIKVDSPSLGGDSVAITVVDSRHLLPGRTYPVELKYLGTSIYGLIIPTPKV